MKKLLLITLTTLLLNNIGYTQSRNLTYPENKRVYVGLPIEEIKKTLDVIQNNYDKNIAKFYDFYNTAIKNLDSDKSSIKYRSQVYAINNYVEALKTYQDGGNWEDATYDLLKAESQYYYDLQNYSTIENKK